MIQRTKFVVEQLGDSMVTNLVNSVFLRANGIIEMAMVLDTYVDPPTHIAGSIYPSWTSLTDPWRNQRIMSSFEWNRLLADCLTTVMQHMCHQLVLKTVDISKLITPWKGPTTEKNAISFISALRLTRKGVGQSLLGAETMAESTKKAILNAIPAEVAKVMRLNQTLIGPGTVVSVDTFMMDILQTTKVFAESDALNRFRLQHTHNSTPRQAHRVEAETGNQQETIESLKVELAKTKEFLASMQKAKGGDTKYAKIRREANKATVTKPTEDIATSTVNNVSTEANEQVGIMPKLSTSSGPNTSLCINYGSNLLSCGTRDRFLFDNGCNVVTVPDICCLDTGSFGWQMIELTKSLLRGDLREYARQYYRRPRGA